MVMWFDSKTVFAANAMLFNSINPVEHLAFGFLGTENNNSVYCNNLFH